MESIIKILIASFLLTEYLMIPFEDFKLILETWFFKNPNKYIVCWFRACELKIFAFKTDKVKLFNPSRTLESPGECFSVLVCVHVY